MRDDDLCYMTAAEAIALFQRRALSPVELTRAVLARAEQVDPLLNALTATFPERALEQARAAEAAYARGAARPLEGIPLAVKDFHEVAGEITTFGSKLFAGHRSATTAPTVARLLEAGAILHARTATPEFAIGLVTHGKQWGVTRNPWNLDVTPGGSSGGAGAAVAAGMTTLADGTDSGGSIRAPAAFCGLFGYLPPYGRNPLDAGFAYGDLLRYGPIVRSVADGALMQNVMSGQHPEDPASLSERLRLPESFAPARGLRIALSLDLGFVPVEPEVEAAVRQAAAVFRDLGCVVEEVSLPWTGAVAEAMDLWVYALMQGAYGGRSEAELAEMMPHVAGLIQRGRTLTAAEYHRFFATRTAMYAALRPILEGYDLLLCPTLGTARVKADHDNADPGFTINGKPVGAYLAWSLTYPFNMLVTLPVASVPCGFAGNAVPIGMQLVGRPYDDPTVFRAAAAFEAAQPWAGYRPSLTAG